MSSQRSVVLSGVIAAIVAIALIGTVLFVPGLGIGNKQGSSSGAFSIMLTDPPAVPNGTSQVYMTYNKVGVHITGQGNESQYWDILAQSGTINLMQSVNISQTLGVSSTLPTGRSYNAVGFNITSVKVTYLGVNYSADLVYGQNRLYVAIPGGISVSATQTQAVLVDMTPKILLLGSPQNPTFAFLPSARAYVVPSASVPSEARTVGARHNLDGDSWWAGEVGMTHFGITGVRLSSNSLQVNVTNSGDTSIVFKLASVTSGLSISGGYIPPLRESAVFLIESNGSLSLLNETSSSQLYAAIASDGYVLAPHANATFTFKGTIQTGLMQFTLNTSPAKNILSSQNYVVRLFGNDKVAAAGTTAS